MAILASTKDGAVDMGTRSSGILSDSHRGLVGIGQEEVATIIDARILVDGLEGNTLARAEHMAIIVFVVHTDGASVDIHIAVA